MKIYHLMHQLEQQEREDAIFEELFKHSTKYPDQYLDTLENLLLVDSPKLIQACRESAPQLSCFVNRVCCHFIHNLNIDRTFRADLYSYLQRLLVIMDRASEKAIISLYLENFFANKTRFPYEPETPTPYDRLQITLKKYENLGQGLVDAPWKEKQKFGQRLARYPHLYKHCMTGKTNTNFRQLSHERQMSYIQGYNASLYGYLRQETMKDNNPDLASAFSSTTSTVKEKENPTRLDKDELYNAIGYFSQTPQQLRTIATKVSYSYSAGTLLDAKLYLYKAIMNLFVADYKKAYLGDKLLQLLQSQTAEYNSQKSEAVLIQQTIDFILKFLVIDENKNHYFFIDMLSNLGTKRTIDILFQLVYCYPLKPEEREQKMIRLLHSLEERLALLFQHYRDYEEEEMQWLIHFFENFNVASALHFDGLDLTGIEFQDP